MYQLKGTPVDALSVGDFVKSIKGGGLPDWAATAVKLGQIKAVSVGAQVGVSVMGNVCTVPEDMVVQLVKSNAKTLDYDSTWLGIINADAFTTLFESVKG